MILDSVLEKSDEISEKVGLGDLDFGIRYFKDLVHENLEQTQIASEKFVVICSAKTVRKIPREISDLKEVKWIVYERNGGTVPYTSLLDNLLVTHQIWNENRRMNVDSLTAQKRLVEADFGFAFVPLSGIEEEIRIGSLRVVNIENFTATAPIYAAFRQPSTSTKLSDEFISLLKS